MNLLRWITHHYIFIGLVLLLIVFPFALPPEWIDGARDFIARAGLLPGLFMLGVILFVSTVIAPLNTLSLVPFASLTFGWKLTSIVCITAWTLGAVVAFLLSRHFGKRALKLSLV